MTENKVTQRDLFNEINNLRKEVRQEFSELKKNYVTREEFVPVKNFVDKVFMVGGLILLSLLGLMLAHVIPGFGF
jgi:hypothetical protein